MSNNSSEDHSTEDHSHSTEEHATEDHASEDQFNNVDSVITNFTLNTVTDVSGVEIINQSGTDVNGNYITNTFLTTLDPSYNLQISETLTQVVNTYQDETCELNGDIVNQIKQYASEIKCSSFHGNGTIDDYSELFNAASNIANESKQMALSVDLDGFNEFADAADQLSHLFTGFILKLQNVNIIDDTLFLNSILNALKKIVNLSNTFGKFKETIIATSIIQIPQSCHDTVVVLQGVMEEINCAMTCINYFVNPTENVPDDVLLNTSEKQMIDTAVSTIKQWNVLCEQGVTIAMNNDVDIKNINTINNTIQIQTSSLNNAISILTNKFNLMNRI